jgi:hypothetical protein
VPSPWAAEQSRPTVPSKVMGFFYKKLQYHDTVDHAKRNREQPQPKSLNILARRPEAVDRYVPPDPEGENVARVEER